MCHTRGRAAVVAVIAAISFESACSGGRKQAERGDQYFQQGNYRAASVEYRAAVTSEPKDAALRQKLARTYLAMGAFDVAKQEFVRAADLLPEDAAAQLDAGEALLRTGEFRDAVTRAETVISKDPRSVRAHLLKGLGTAGLKDLNGAGEDIRKALELDPQLSAGYTNLGAIELVQGRAQEAEAAFKQAAKLAPADVQPQLALSNYYWRMGRREEAEVALKAAVSRKPDDLEANRTLALFYIAMGRSPEAEAPLKVAAGHRDVPEAQLALADYYIALKRAPEARALLEDLAKQPAAYAAAQSRLAGVEYIDGKRDRAYQTVEEILKRQPGNAQVLVLKARWLLAEGRTDDALAAAKAAASADPKAVEAQFVLGNVHAARRENRAAISAYSEVLQLNPRAVPAQLELARLSLATGDAVKAVQFAEGAVQNAPNILEARLALVQSLRSKGDFSRATTELTPLMKAAPKSAAVHVQAGEIALGRKDVLLAKSAFEEALRLDQDSRDALSGLVRIDLAEHNVQNARRRLEGPLRRRPKDVPLLTMAGRSYAIAGDLPLAEATLQKAIGLDPGYLPAYNYLGQIYVRQNRLDEARQRYEAMAKQQPDSVPAHTMVAMLLQVQNRPAEAQARYERILQIDSRSVVAANNLAYMKAESGTDLNQALQLAQTAKSVKPDDPDVNDTLGWIYYKKDLAALAVEPLRLSVEKGPSNAIYRYHLGLVYLKTGDKTKAREMLEQALKLDPKFEGAAEAKRALDTLGS
jgi:tetratricopeptide (TPR) repeat protein